MEDPEAASTLPATPMLPPTAGEHISCAVDGLTHAIIVMTPVTSNEAELPAST
jgi:hypothetical protein